MTMRSKATVFSIPRALLIAGALLGVSLALRLLSPTYLSAELSTRLLGVLMGCVVVLYANAVPKVLRPLFWVRGDPAAEQALHRFTGWCLVLGGLAFAFTWILAPLPRAGLLSAGLLGAATLAVIVRIAWGMAKRADR
jgi:hypothetical protein